VSRLDRSWRARRLAFLTSRPLVPEGHALNDEDKAHPANNSYGAKVISLMDIRHDTRVHKAMDAKNLNAISNTVTEQHKNFVLDDVNDHCLRMAVMNEKTFPWHSHPDSDELFIIVEGKLLIEFKDESSVTLQAGDFHKVKAGKIHRTIAIGRTVNLCFESTKAATVFLSSEPSVK